MVAVLLATGMMTLNVTPGNVPHVALEGGKAPEVNANMATIQLGTSNRTIDVPTVTTTQRTVSVPTLTIEKPRKRAGAGPGARQVSVAVARRDHPGAGTIAAAVLLPPLGVFWRRGAGLDFIVACGLTVLGYLPGVVFALLRVLGPRPR